MPKIDQWIIGTGGSHADDVFTYIVEGTDSQVKHHLLSRARDGRLSCEDEYGCKVDYCPKLVSDIEVTDDGNRFYTVVAHPECHIDYTARRIIPKQIVKL